MTAFAPEIALDALFRRNVVTRGDERAILDHDGVSLSYLETATAVASIAAQIASLRLPPDSVIALHLPNGRELVLALLAVMRSGLIAVPMPVAWRKADLVRACREAEAAALITSAHYTAENLPELAVQVAIEVFELSFPCAFGASLPDGILPLDYSTASDPSFANAAITDARSSGIGTLQPASGGVRLVFHRDEELLAAGLGAMLAGNIQSGDRIVSAVSFSSLAGLAAAFVPWLLSGGCITLLPDFPAENGLVLDAKTHLVAAAGAINTLCALTPGPIASACAVHFGGTSSVANLPPANAVTLVDAIALSEYAIVALPRIERGVVASIPLGEVRAGDAGVAAPVIAETNIERGQLQLRGAAIPKDAINDQPWLDTGFTAHPTDTGRCNVGAPPELLHIGGLRFDLPDLERRVRSAALVAAVYAIPDPVLGMRLVIESERTEDTTRALLDAGLPKVVADAVRKSETTQARAG